MMKAICAMCLRVRDCWRVVGFGYLCEECYKPEQHGGLNDFPEQKKAGQR